MPSVEVRRYGEPGPGGGVADEVEDFGVTVQRLGGPVLGDFGKQAVLDGIPLGSAGGVMSNGDGEPKAVAELALKLGFPGAGTATIAAAGIGQDEQLAAAVVAICAVAFVIDEIDRVMPRMNGSQQSTVTTMTTRTMVSQGIGWK